MTKSPRTSGEVDLETSFALAPDVLAFLQDRLHKAIGLLNRQGSELCVRLVDDKTIQALHRHYMDDDTPTDVLSFEQDVPPPGQAGLLGDIVISVETATRQAQEKKWSLREELLYLGLHGLLHLLGYDHATPEEEREMFGIHHELFDRLTHS